MTFSRWFISYQFFRARYYLSLSLFPLYLKKTGVYRQLAGTNNIQDAVLRPAGRRGNAEFGSSDLFV